MSTVQPTRAPLLIDKLSSEELLQRYLDTREDMYVLALWERYIDRANSTGFYRNLKWRSRRSCPPGYNPDWMFLGSQARVFFRFKRNVAKFAGKLDTPSFGAYRTKLIKGAVLDEHRFITGQGRKIWVQIDEDFDVVDDIGNIVRTDRAEELELWEDLDRARLADEQQLAGEEGVEPGEARQQTEKTEEVAPEEIQLDHPPEADQEENVPEGDFRSPRKERIWSALAQPLPRADAALSREERYRIVKRLLIWHMVNEAKPHSNDVIVRHYFRNWPKARIAVLLYGKPNDDTELARYEHRVRRIETKDLQSLRRVLRKEFNVTSLRQV